jgi:hypothetical protein
MLGSVARLRRINLSSSARSASLMRMTRFVVRTVDLSERGLPAMIFVYTQIVRVTSRTAGRLVRENPSIEVLKGPQEEQMRHARLTLSDEQLDELHNLKRRLARERKRPVTLDELLGEAATMLLRYHGFELREPANREEV